MLNINQSEEKFQKIYDDAQSNLNNIQSEEDTKLQLINSILMECLNWRKKDISTESYTDSGFADYILSTNSKPSLVIEAKRIGAFEIKIVRKDQPQRLKISGSSLKNIINNGLDQAASYAFTKGIFIAVLTDGIQWVIFQTIIPGENYKDKEAIIFPSLNAILNEYSLFFELLERENFSKNTYKMIFDQSYYHRIMLTGKLNAPFNNPNIVSHTSPSLTYDLQNVFNYFFDQITEKDNNNILIECFVESKESKIADFSLAKITQGILGCIDSKEGNVSSKLSDIIRQTVEIKSVFISGQTIFIVGPTGSGKTTFLQRFFEQTLPKSIKDRCILISINCLDTREQEKHINDWLVEQVIALLEQELYKGNGPKWNELKGLYYKEYQDREKGIYAELYKVDKSKFDINFGKFLEKEIYEKRDTYLQRILIDVIENRKRLPIIILDNTDEFPLEMKEALFQFTQTINRQIKHSLLLFPVTDKSFWTLSKTDIFGIYKSRNFFLPTPSPREVFRKRIDYLSKKINDKETVKKVSYFSEKGIKISIPDLSKFVQILEIFFVNHDYTSKILGELTNYNIRRILALSQRIITSPVIRIENLVQYYSNKDYTIKIDRFLDALMKGNYEIYKEGDIPELYSIFQIDTKICHSPLLKLRILSFLQSTYILGRNIEDKHETVESIISYFSAIGCAEETILPSLNSLLDSKLIEIFDISDKELQINSQIAISYKGRIHANLASTSNVFFYQMALTTAILDEEAVLNIRMNYKNKELSFLQKLTNIKKIFLTYLLTQDSHYITLPDRNSGIGYHKIYDNQYDIVEKLKKLCMVNSKDSLKTILSNDYSEGKLWEKVTVSVEMYDFKKKYGFAKLDAEDNVSAYFATYQILEHKINYVMEGDKFVCDVSRSEKGFQVDKIHRIDINNDNYMEIECEILTVYEERNYGFAKAENSDRNIFFYTSIFPEILQKYLKTGFKFRAHVVLYLEGNFYQVRKII